LLGVHQWSIIEDYITEGIAKKHREGAKRVDVPPPDVIRRFAQRRLR
jgi:hypothetical protein